MARGIIIFGSACSGKTTLGKLVAQKLDFPYFDIDDYIWRKYIDKPFTVMYTREEKINRLMKDLSKGIHFIIAGSMDSFNQPFVPLCLVNVVRFTIQGMGYSIFAILAGVCEMAARSVCGFVMVPIFGYIAVCLASPFAWICADAFLIPAYYIVLKKLKKDIDITIHEEKMYEKSM